VIANPIEACDVSAWGENPGACIAGNVLLGFGQIIERARDDGGPKAPFVGKHGGRITETVDSKKGEFWDQ
jgi:hypothetical protein